MYRSGLVFWTTLYTGWEGGRLDHNICCFCL